MTAIEINASDSSMNEKLYPFFNRYDVTGNTQAPAHKLTMNFIERTLPLQLS